MDAHLAQLVRMGRISRELAMERASVPEELKRLMGGAAPQPNGGGMPPQAAQQPVAQPQPVYTD